MTPGYDWKCVKNDDFPLPILPSTDTTNGLLIFLEHEAIILCKFQYLETLDLVIKLLEGCKIIQRKENSVEIEKTSLPNNLHFESNFQLRVITANY